MYNLHRFLVDYDMAMLRALAQNRGAPLSTNRQGEAADHLAVVLLEPVSVRTALARLGPGARQALQTLLAAGGRMRAAHFGRRFGNVRPMGPGRIEREAPWQQPDNPAEELLYAGLVFRGFAQDEAGAGEFFFVPQDLMPLLPQPRVEPPVFAVEPVPARLVKGVPAQPGDGQQPLVGDFFVYLVHLQNHSVRTTPDGRLGQADRNTLRGRMANPDERRLAFLCHLATRLQFVVRHDRLLRLETARVRSWLKSAPARQLSALQEAWRDDPTWNDLCQVPGLDCDLGIPWRNDPVATRQALLALLARCPQDAWWSLPSFVTAIKEYQPDFQRPDGDYTGWHIRDAASGAYLSGFESWDAVEGALIADLLHGPLRWLGIVDVARAETPAQEPVFACRLTAAGAHFLGLASGEAEPPPAPPIVVRPDFTIEVPSPASLYTQFQLERFALFEKGTPGRYRLTVGSLGQALARGIRLEQVLDFLQEASRRPVPGNVAGQLGLWAGRFDQVRLEEVTLLRARSERVIKELSVLPETRDLITQVISPTTALVRKRDLPQLQSALLKLGYLAPNRAGGEPSGDGPPPVDGAAVGDGAKRG